MTVAERTSTMNLGRRKTVIKLCGIRVTKTQRMGIVSGKAISVRGELIQIRDSTVSSKIRPPQAKRRAAGAIRLIGPGKYVVAIFLVAQPT